jgi:hypothetical protein
MIQWIVPETRPDHLDPHPACIKPVGIIKYIIIKLDIHVFLRADSDHGGKWTVLPGRKPSFIYWFKNINVGTREILQAVKW